MFLKFSNKSFPGILITFCGLDGTGKTTLITKLSERLQGMNYKNFCTYQPSKEVRQSELFRRFVDTNNHEGLEYRSLSLLTVSDRVQHSTQVILPRLRKGEIVISDRYFFSALVNLRARGYREDKWIYEIASYLPRPDLPFFLETDFDLSLRRVHQRSSEKDKWIDFEFNKLLYDEFKYVCNISSGISIDSSQSPEITFETVWEYVNNILKDKLGGVICNE